MNILLTGANGYIGRRLKHRLLNESGVNLRLFVKYGQTLTAQEKCEIVEGNTFDVASRDRARKGIDVA